MVNGFVGIGGILCGRFPGRRPWCRACAGFRDLARMSVLGAFYGTLFSIPIVYFLPAGRGKKGVVPSLVCVAAMGILTSWWYARKIKVEKVSLTGCERSSNETSGSW
jgi:hypothetical protein